MVLVYYNPVSNNCLQLSQCKRSRVLVGEDMSIYCVTYYLSKRKNGRLHNEISMAEDFDNLDEAKERYGWWFADLEAMSNDPECRGSVKLYEPALFPDGSWFRQARENEYIKLYQFGG